MLCTSECSATWNERKKVIVLQDGHTWARGLTKTLAANFSPEFSISLVLKSIKNIKPKKRGRYTGNLVDKQISDWVNGASIHKPDPKFAVILQCLAKQKLTPVASQVDIGCSTLRLGTRVDLVCENEDKELVIIEIKCGFDDYYDVDNQGCFEFPFNHIPITFRNKHYIQLMLTTWMFNHSLHPYSNRVVDHSCIIRVFETDDGKLQCDFARLPTWTNDTQLLGRCLRMLENTKNRTKRKRNNVIKNGSRRIRRKLGSS